jgi:hypothetical protein
MSDHRTRTMPQRSHNTSRAECVATLLSTSDGATERIDFPDPESLVENETSHSLSRPAASDSTATMRVYLLDIASEGIKDAAQTCFGIPQEMLEEGFLESDSRFVASWAALPSMSCRLLSATFILPGLVSEPGSSPSDAIHLAERGHRVALWRDSEISQYT